MLKGDASGLTNENNELKLHLEALKQQAQLRNARNETLRQEIESLRIGTGKVSSSNSNMNQGPFPEISTADQNMTSFGHPAEPAAADATAEAAEVSNADFQQPDCS